MRAASSSSPAGLSSGSTGSQHPSLSKLDEPDEPGLQASGWQSFFVVLLLLRLKAIHPVSCRGCRRRLAGKPVTKSDLSLCAPAQVAAVRRGLGLMPIKAMAAQMGAFCPAARGTGIALRNPRGSRAGRAFRSPWLIGGRGLLLAVRAGRRRRRLGATCRMTSAAVSTKVRRAARPSPGHAGNRIYISCVARHHVRHDGRGRSDRAAAGRARAVRPGAA